jgi:hypothetical protein
MEVLLGEFSDGSWMTGKDFGIHTYVGKTTVALAD